MWRGNEGKLEDNPCTAEKTVLAGKQLHTTMQDLLLLKFGSLEVDLHGP